MLVWSCLATIITCTWSVLHLNVPSLLHDSPRTKRLRKLKWMAITILFPEFIFSKAVCELKNAIDDLYQMKKESELNWKVEFGLGCQRLYWIFHLFDRSVDEKHKSTVVAEVAEVAAPLHEHLDEESDDDSPPSSLGLGPTAPGIELQPSLSSAATPEEHLAREELQNEDEDRINSSDLRSSPVQGDALTTEPLNLKFIPFNQGEGVEGRHKDQR
jgi:hypothetical protein